MIYVSVGHHVAAQGAEYKGITEYHLAGIYVDKICELLGDKATRVPNGSLKPKVTFVNERQKKGDIAVEIHFNDFQVWVDANNNDVVDEGEMIRAGKGGSETLFYPGSIKGKAIAEKVQEDLGRIMKPDRGVAIGYYKRNKENGPNYWLRKTNCIAIMIEPQFINRINDIRNKMNEACASIASSLLEI